MSNAYIGVLSEYGDPTTWTVESWDDIAEMFAKYIRNVRVCSENLNSGTKSKCFKNVLRKKPDDLLNICNSDTSQNYEVKILKLCNYTHSFKHLNQKIQQ